MTVPSLLIQTRGGCWVAGPSLVARWPLRNATCREAIWICQTKIGRSHGRLHLTYLTPVLGVSFGSEPNKLCLAAAERLPKEAGAGGARAAAGARAATGGALDQSGSLKPPTAAECARRFAHCTEIW